MHRVPLAAVDLAPTIFRRGEEGTLKGERCGTRGPSVEGKVMEERQLWEMRRHAEMKMGVETDPACLRWRDGRKKERKQRGFRGDEQRGISVCVLSDICTQSQPKHLYTFQEKKNGMMYCILY